MSALLLILAAAAVPQDRCREIRYLPDGTRQERWVNASEAGGAAGKYRTDGSTTVSAQSHARGSATASAHSGVSVSSHNGGASSRSVADASNGKRSVHIVKDDGQCTIIIDERGPQ